MYKPWPAAFVFRRARVRRRLRGAGEYQAPRCDRSDLWRNGSLPLFRDMAPPPLMRHGPGRRRPRCSSTSDVAASAYVPSLLGRGACKRWGWLLLLLHILMNLLPFLVQVGGTGLQSVASDHQTKTSTPCPLPSSRDPSRDLPIVSLPRAPCPGDLDSHGPVSSTPFQVGAVPGKVCSLSSLPRPPHRRLPPPCR